MNDRALTQRRNAGRLGVAAMLVAPGCVWAQSSIGTGFFEWQISADAGQTWQAGDVAVPPAQQFVNVRAFVGWSSDAGFAFSGAWFDVTVTGSSGVGAGDSVDSFSRGRMTSGSNQTIVSQRFGDVLKIDDARDTLAPGLGPRGIFPGQLAPEFSPPEFTTANPVMVFTFRLSLDGTLGRRDITSLFIAPTNGNSVDRFLRTYLPFGGGINQPLMTFAPALVTVIPAPAATGLMFGVLAAGRRRWFSDASQPG